MIRLVDLAHEAVAAVLRPGGVAIDATAGNGHDTLFLARIVGPEGLVYSFDIQAEAIDRTRRLIDDNRLANVQLHILDHAKMDEVIPPHHCGRIDAAMFNLGWLPNGDKSVVTRTESTIRSVGFALMILAPGGIMTVIAYPGHPGGDEEAKAVKEMLESLEKSEFKVEVVKPEPISAPILFKVLHCSPSLRDG